MADYPNSKLDKALARRAASTINRASWQEWMERHDTVPGFAIQAPEVLQGFSGSWAAQYGLDNSVKGTSAQVSPAQVQRQVNHLGLPGMAEIAFRPYDWGTTRHGKYGPSLLGHPVSFEVVGPTAKSPQLYHQWVLNTAGAQDILTIDAITWRSTVAVPEALFATLDEIPEIYGIATIPEEGLYLVVSLTGHKGYLDDVGGGVPGVGGLGDGTIGQQADLLDPRTAISTPNNGVGQKAKFEVFRVEDMDATSITLAAGKRIADYFTVPGGTAIIRAVTLIKPAAARLVAVPGSGEPGKEQVFAFVPPEKALTSDLQAPYALWTLGFCDPWLNYNGSASTGAVGDYDQKNALPIPKPVRQGTGRLQGIFGEIPVALSTGGLQVMLDTAASFSAADAGKIVRIYSVTRHQDGNWSSATVDGGNRVGDPELDRLLGYWVIDLATAGAPNSYNLRMVSQVDPLTGVPFPGSSEFMHMAQGDLAAGKEVRLQWTLHEPVSSLWTDRHLQPDKLDSARLRGLIDPSWVKPSSKNIDLADTEASPARPDRAVFNTITGEDPGSLLDLGFRPVFYPAKVSVTDPTTLVPDFENPITSNELMLDPTLPTEQQFLEVDYSAGLVTLSHPPKAGIGCQLAPDSLALLNASNPRREMTFFASFVPFSQEPGQRGVVPRVTGGQYLTAPGSACEDAVESQDVYGSRLHWPLASGQTITSGTAFQIKLDVQLNAIDLPPAGFIEVVNGADVPLGTPGWMDGADRRVSTFGYTSVIYIDAGNGGNTTLEGCFGGGVDGAAITTSALATPLTAVLRRDVVSPNRGDGSTGTDFQSDTTYGSSKRGVALRFKRATTSMEPDGSLTVDTRDPLTLSHQSLFADLFSSWVLSGGEQTNTLGVDAYLAFTELTVVIAGVRSVLPAQTFSVTPGASRYVYIDGSSPACPVYAFDASLPLPGSNDILIGYYTIPGVVVATYEDLRQPLVDLDKRLDITVGDPQGHDQPAEAHFSTLAAAVTYAALTMRPASGLHGKYRRIKVIGPTLEDSTKLPIRPRLPGLIIEGAARSLDGTNAVPQEISWGGATAPALFDLSGCDGIVIRDVNFRFIDSAVSAVPRERCLFTADYTTSGAEVKNVLVENVTLAGAAHGFFYVNDDLDANTGFDGVIFRNCVATELTDFAIWCDATVDPADNLLIDRCHFTVRKSTDAPGPELALADDTGVLCHTGTASYNWIVTNTALRGGRFGARLGGSYHTFRNVTVTIADKFGLMFSDPDQVLLDKVTVLGCFTVAGVVLGAPSKTAVFFENAGSARMTHCQVAFSPHAGADYAVYTAPTTGASLDLHNCQFQAQVNTGPDSKVTGCTVYEGLYLDDNSKAAYNLVDAVLGAGDLEAGDNVVLTGNVAQGVFNTADSAGSAHLSHNTFQGAGSSTISDNSQCSGDKFTGEVQIGNDCILNGVWLAGGVTDPGGSVSGVTLSGCQINYAASTAMLVEKSLFTANKFSVTGADRTLTFDGLANSFIGNQVAGNVTVLFQETAASARTALVIQGNLFRRTGVAVECGLVVYGDFCLVEGNLVEGIQTVFGTDGIRVCGPGGVNAGSHNTISGNIVGRPAAALGLACNVTESVISGNRAFGALTTSVTTHNTTIADNVLGEEGVTVATMLNVAAGVGLTVTGNVVEGDVLFTATSSVFANNRVSEDATLAGADTLYSDNRIGGVCTLSGANSVIGGNIFSGVCTVSGADCTFSGNDVGGIFTASGTKCVISGCRVTDEVHLDADDITCTGSQLGAAGKSFLAQASNLNFKDNTVAGAVTFGGTAAFEIQNLVGNHFQSTVALPALWGIRSGSITGNTFEGIVDTSAAYLSDCTVSGNVFRSTFICPDGNRNIFSGNRFGDTVTLTNQDDSVIQGNLALTVAGVAVGMDLTGSTNYVCVGNQISGTLLVDDAGGAGGSGVVVGNRAAVIATNNLPNAGTVVVGNKTTNAGGNTNFNTAPGVGPIINDNVEV